MVNILLGVLFGIIVYLFVGFIVASLISKYFKQLDTFEFTLMTLTYPILMPTLGIVEWLGKIPNYIEMYLFWLHRDEKEYQKTYEYCKKLYVQYGHTIDGNIVYFPIDLLYIPTQEYINFMEMEPSPIRKYKFTDKFYKMLKKDKLTDV